MLEQTMLLISSRALVELVAMVASLVSGGGVMVPVGQQVAPIVGAPANLAGNLYNARGRAEREVFSGRLASRRESC